MEIFAVIVCVTGAAFLFVFAGALSRERDGASSETEILDMFGDIL